MNTRAAVEACALLAVGVTARLLPHLPNMTPVGAIALRARARFGAWGLAIPMAAMLLSDLVIGLYNLRLLAGVYTSFIAMGLLGYFLKQKAGIARLSLVAFAGSLLFFLITNAAVWTLSPWYEKSMLGLATCYFTALPFFASTIVGDQLFTFMLFRYERAPRLYYIFRYFLSTDQLPAPITRSTTQAATKTSTYS